MSGSLLTASEVAELLGVPTSLVYEQSRRGRIPTVTLGLGPSLRRMLPTNRDVLARPGALR